MASADDEEDDRRAHEQADLGGRRPSVHAAHAAIVTAVGCYMLLHIFCGIIAAPEFAYDVADGMTLTLAAAVAAIQWWRDRSWSERYSRAHLNLMKERAQRRVEADARWAQRRDRIIGLGQHNRP